MTSLLTAIQTLFTSSLAGSITGGLYIGVVPPGTAAPYAVMNVISSPTTQTYGTVGGFTEPEIQFTVRSSGAAAALALAESLRDAYKNQVLSLSSGKMLNTVLTQDPIPEPQDPTQDESGNDSFGWIISFRFATT